MRACEVGVLKGDNATRIYEELKPKSFFLIDKWEPINFYEDGENKDSYFHEFLKGDAKYQDKVKKYFGGELTDKITFDRLYEKVEKEFREKKGSRILREDSITALKNLRREIPDFTLDYCYIDANHDYEYALNDLLYHKDVISTTGIFQLNDCCHSSDGVKQDLGVLEATIKFCKIANFVPVAITNTNWSDVILTSCDSPVLAYLNHIFETSNISFVEIPDSLLGSARNKGINNQLSFL